MTKKLIATHDQIDPAMVTAEDLVRAIHCQGEMILAARMGLTIPTLDTVSPSIIMRGLAAYYIAQNLDLPEPRDNQIIWRDGAEAYLPHTGDGGE